MYDIAPVSYSGLIFSHIGWLLTYWAHVLLCHFQITSYNSTVEMVYWLSAASSHGKSAGSCRIDTGLVMEKV